MVDQPKKTDGILKIIQMTISKLNKNYWENNYQNDQIGWDIGTVSSPLKEYFDQLESNDLNVLIPGAGNSYEAEYLFHNRQKQVNILDIAKHPLDNFKRRNPDFPNSQLIQSDFFLHKIKYDLIIEQTFFCALDPKLRSDYANKINDLLKPGGKLAGVLFDFPLTEQGPPFGGSRIEYENIFSKHFRIKVLDRCYNSIKSRQKRELFIIFEKK